jgi:hypothetical protein
VSADPLWRERLSLAAQVEKLKVERRKLREKPKNPHRSYAAKRAWKEGRQSRRVIVDPAEMPQQHDAFMSELYSDLGGEDELSTLEKSLAKRIGMLEVLIVLYQVDLATRGALTLKGKVRSTVDALYKAMDRQERIGKQLGWKRRKKEAGGSIADWMASRAKDVTP